MRITPVILFITLAITIISCNRQELRLTGCWEASFSEPEQRKSGNLFTMEDHSGEIQFVKDKNGIIVYACIVSNGQIVELLRKVK